MLICTFLIWAVKYRRCTIKIFNGGDRGGGWGGGPNSERCLKWGVGGSLKNLFQNSLKEGVGKGRNYM